MGKLLCILGKSGVGKDTLLNNIIKDSHINITPIIPYTTRPKRENEIDGVHYHFVSKSYMDKLERKNKIIERREYPTKYGTWHYFTVFFDISSSSTFITITTPYGSKMLSEKIGKDNLIIVYLEASDKVRLERSILRESKEYEPNYSEVCRRFLADEEDFRNDDFFQDLMIFTINANFDATSCLNQFKSIFSKIPYYESKSLLCASFKQKIENYMDVGIF